MQELIRSGDDRQPGDKGQCPAGRPAPAAAAPPGLDEITLSAPQGKPLCNSRACASAGQIAEVIVTFGQLADPGSRAHSPGDLWPECWSRSYPMCGPCWHSTRQVAVRFRPRLAIRDTTQPPGQPARQRPARAAAGPRQEQRGTMTTPATPASPAGKMLPEPDPLPGLRAGFPDFRI